MLLFRRLRLGDVALSLDTFVKSPLVDTRSVFMDTVSCQAEELFMQLPPSCDGRLATHTTHRGPACAVSRNRGQWCQ